jgi:hypothetical protein
MAKAFHTIVMQAMKLALGKVHVFTLSCDEVILVDNQFWLSIHAYTIQNWIKVPMLLFLECLVHGFNATNLIINITQTIFVNEGISNFHFIF